MTKQEVLPKTSKKPKVADKPATKQATAAVSSSTAAPRRRPSKRNLNASLPAPGADPIQPDGLILTRDLPNGLTLMISEYQLQGFSEFDEITIYVNDTAQIEGIQIPADHPPGTFPVYQALSREQLGGDGVRHITFTVKNDNIAESLPRRVIVDTLDPALNNPPPKPLLPEDLAGIEITPQYLADHGDVLTLDVPRYPDPKPGDRWALYLWSQSSAQKVGNVVGDDSGGRAYFTIEVTTEELQTLSPGYVELWIKVTDRAGNESQFSNPQGMVLSLEPGPADLEPPVVPDAPIDLQEARNRVLVEVPAYTNWRSGDMVHVYWGETVIGAFTTNDLDVWPLPAYARFEIVDQPEPYTAKVKYIVTRGRTYPSLVAEVEVDTSRVGPPNPDDPEPVNPNLEPALLIGPVSGLENELTPEDKDEDVTVTVQVYDPVNPGEVIRLFYGPEAKLVDTRVIDDEEAGSDIEMTISAADVIEVGNGLEQPLFYRIYKNETATNFQESGPTLVRAVIVQLADLALPVITGVPIPPDSIPRVTCDHAPWNGLTVLVSDPNKLQLGDNVTVHWSMYPLRGSDPVEGTVVSLPGEVSGQNHIDFGLPISVLWSYMQPAPPLAEIRVRWSVIRDGIPVGESEERLYHYSTVVGTITCVPSFAKRRKPVRVGKL
ncbi:MULTISPECIES: hypothetical protein [Pseudomonas]|uniref:Uncharacterized protein n=1 Tax=Pseudomonas fluorescens TaxID=294 RepID=A0A5E6QIY7_PSEFL|nr:MULTISPECIES: hypothetical protein [Pseudomonas]VVM55249.1 hypothetical protein PS652_01000 [Pseudomonas fluorescens]